MLYRSLLSSITSYISTKNKYIINVMYCSTSSYDSLHLKKTKLINTVQVEEESEKVKLNEEKKRKQNKKEKKIAKENMKCTINNYVQNMNSNTDICSKDFVSERNKTILDLIDEETAEKYVSLIIKDLLKNTCFVAELNPSFGILTNKLLEAGVPLIHLYEARKIFHPMLKKIHSNYPDRLDVKKFNLLKIGLTYKNKDMDKEQIELLQDVENKKWEDETCMQVLGTINSSFFFENIIKSLIFHNCLMSNGRPVFYIMMPPSIWHKFTCDTSNAKLYTSLKVMFQTMFHYELLGILDRNAFRPFPKQKKKYLRNSTFNKIKKQDYENIYVVKLEPRTDLYSELTKKDWILFWYFVRCHMHKRCNRLIPNLEKWVPDCGIKLIAKNYTIFTQIKDLTPAQILEIFKEFKSWPESKEAVHFLTNMNKSVSDIYIKYELLSK